jgi:hypothetical protein
MHAARPEAEIGNGDSGISKRRIEIAGNGLFSPDDHVAQFAAGNLVVAATAVDQHVAR